MATHPLELEGTWEEILAHAAELRGRRVRLTVLPSDPAPSSETQPPPEHSTAATLLQFASTWVGDDFEECLAAVYATRLPAEF